MKSTESASGREGSPRSAIVIALELALVIGVIAGAIEGLWLLAENAYVAPARYVGFYLSAPVFLWTLAIVLPTLVLGLCLRWRGGLLDGPDLKGWVFRYLGTLALLLTVLGTVLYLRDLHATVAATGASAARVVVLAGLVAFPLIGVVAAAFVHSFGTMMLAVLRRSWNRALVSVLVGVNVVALGVLGERFFSEGRGILREPLYDRERRVDARTNVVLISVDTLRADALQVYGSAGATTPNLDRLAEQGVLFENTISSSPWTLPAMASVMTGLNPSRHGAGQSLTDRDLLAKSPLSGKETLAEILARNGYRTQAIVTNPYLSLHYGLGAGFAGYESVTVEAEAFEVLSGTLLFRVALAAAPELAIRDNAEAVSNRAERWLAHHKQDRFFLWLHFIDPHAPYHGGRRNQSKSFRGDTLLSRDRSRTLGRPEGLGRRARPSREYDNRRIAA
jgi:Sulfatase